ncbi:plasmid pRiA4b ORF-3 family protein [Geodermatophilus sp. URMC 62]|uniref:plasmid pRiA4b ORF-3 family protein n=1 Tax=Geodermatophilus sp. URMC 62 TaxID=3423414 RepID=UPI00406CDE10
METRDVAELIDRLRRSRSAPMLRLIDDAALDAGPAPEPDPAAVEPYRWLLARVGDGVRLTQAGYLPTAMVTETMRSLGWDADWIGKQNREDQTLPVLLLRDSARRFGLLRTSRGVLLPTVAGRRLTDDPIGLWWHLADRLPLTRGEAERVAGLLYLIAVAARRPRPQALVAEALGVLGWADRSTGRPPDEMDVVALTRDTATVLDRLGLLEGRPRAERRPGPGAVQLARAALLRNRAPEPALASAGPPASGRRDEAVELTVVLRDTEPPVWRRLLVPASLSLRQLHAVLQTAMGWQDAHLHLFEVAGVRYGDVEDLADPLGDEETTTVGDAAAVTRVFRYDYDFGDGWEHDVRIGERLASVGPGTPRCLDGGRACPPEDCGGPPGYERLLAVLADPADPERPELLEWLGGEFDPDAFDVAATDDLLELYDRHTRQRTRR